MTRRERVEYQLRLIGGPRDIIGPAPVLGLQFDLPSARLEATVPSVEEARRLLELWRKVTARPEDRDQ